MEQSTNKDYDATLVASVADLAIADRTLTTDVRIKQSGSETYTTIQNGLGIAALTMHDKLAAILAKKVLSPDQKALDYVNKAVRWAERTFTKGIAEQVMNQRIDLVLLVNSGGGSTYPAESIISLIEHIKKGAGRVTVYGSSNVGSAALQIYSGASFFTAADNLGGSTNDQYPGLPERRIALDSTMFLEHYGHNTRHPGELKNFQYPEPKTPLEVLKRDFTSNLILTKVENGIRSAVKAKIDSARNDQTNPLSNAYFSGSQLPGFVTQTHANFASMQSAIELQTGLTLQEEGWQKDPISRFVAFSKIEEELRTRGYINAALGIDSKGRLKLLQVPDSDAPKIITEVVKPILNI